MSRPTKTEATRQAQQTLDEASVYAAKLVRDVVRGKTLDDKGKTVKTPRISASKLVAAKIAIEHGLGLPKAKILIKTGAYSMKDIAELAADFGGDDGDNGDKDGDNGDKTGDKDGKTDDVFFVPTRPLTKRQLKERGLLSDSNAGN